MNPPSFSINTKQIAQAAAILRGGKLVAFPTETVYGLGADATRADAVARIFAAKGRPASNPLIVHVHDSLSARRYCTTWPPIAERLASAFWPGALTLVLPKALSIVPQATAGGPTVGLRVPDHPIALALLGAFDGPVAAPSANRANKVSPTTADHVRRELGTAVDMILDGGPCAVGIESTVLDLSGAAPRLLRPGGISRAAIEAVIGPLVQDIPAAPKVAASPGQGKVHYSPDARIYLFETGDAARFARWRNANAGVVVRLIIYHADIEPSLEGEDVRHIASDPAGYANQLYLCLHQADADGLQVLWIEQPPHTDAWAAVNDRLARAAAGNDRA